MKINDEGRSNAAHWYERAMKAEARLAEADRNEGTLLGMIRHQRDVLRECLPYLNESMAGRRPGRSADDIRAAVKALTTDSAPAVACSECDGAGYLLNLSPAYPNAGREVPCPKCSTDQPTDALEKFARDLAAAQTPLDPAAAKVLRENLHDLYMDGGTSDNGSAG